MRRFAHPSTKSRRLFAGGGKLRPGTVGNGATTLERYRTLDALTGHQPKLYSVEWTLPHPAAH
jgi:hypothetical protein